MYRRPIIGIAVGWTAGIAAAGSSFAVFGLIGAGMAWILAAGVLAKRMSLILAVCVVLVYCAGGGWAQWMQIRTGTSLPDLREAVNGAYPPVTYEAKAEGTIGSAVEIDGDAVTFKLKARKVHLAVEPSTRKVQETVLVRIRLLTEAEQLVAAGWRRGDKVQIFGELERPAGASNFGGFDYRRYLDNVQHIHWLLRVKGAQAASVEGGTLASADSVLGRIDDAREWLGGRLERLYPADQAGYMKGLVIGSSSDLDPDVYRRFAELGLTHILAISGMHVAVFLYVLNAGLRLFRLTRERTLLALALATPVYVLLAGASPSVVRAGAMAVIGLLAARYNRLKDGMHLLAASAILMLLWNPAYVHDIGFQLSFLVTAGLILGTAPLRSVMPQWKRMKTLLDLAAVTIVAQLVSFPVTIFYFNQWNPLSIPANYVLVPFISFIVMPLGAASMVAEPLWPAGGQGMAYAASLLNEVTYRLVESVASLDSWQTIWQQPPIWWMAAWYAALAMGLRAMRAIGEHRQIQSASTADPDVVDTVPLDEGLKPIVRADRLKQIRTLVCAAAAAAALLIYGWMPLAFDRTAAVSVLDIGQGDAILIRTGSGKHILIDGGGTVSFRKQGEEWRDRADPFEVGRKVLVPLLKQRGVHSLDLVIATHLDMDHIVGLRAVVDSVPVKRMWWNGTIDRSDAAADLLNDALDRKIPLYSAEAGMSWVPDNSAKLDVLWPERATDGTIAEADDQNERSVTVLLTLYGRTFLFPGDLGQQTEQRITAGRLSFCSRSGDGLVNASDACLDVLKAGHHGSNGSTSEQWLRYWQPAFTVISAGKGNIYRHPHPDTLARLASEGSGIWRTDRDGEIRFTVQANGVMSIGWQEQKWTR
ncbi:DNA internalization-related competence protein ComEC/Rec2 [Paenibacillus kobensis]|uniref:DNA internalization-related competence protein ComEC/Rec2 n=1 Tax=Paenibacillus kobensis TaxID=59841 RepID=UPI0013E2B404|nr:DNA internalization-related competence protein ComEC/Rec2 [Paenibacillus kobensis]